MLFWRVRETVIWYDNVFVGLNLYNVELSEGESFMYLQNTLLDSENRSKSWCIVATL